MKNYNVCLHQLPFSQITYICYMLVLLLVQWLLNYVDSHPNGTHGPDAKETSEVFSHPIDILKTPPF